MRAGCFKKPVLSPTYSYTSGTSSNAGATLRRCGGRTGAAGPRAVRPVAGSLPARARSNRQRRSAHPPQANRLPCLYQEFWTRKRGAGAKPTRRVADRMGELLGWDHTRRAEEIARYNAEIEPMRRFRTA